MIEGIETLADIAGAVKGPRERQSLLKTRRAEKAVDHCLRVRAISGFLTLCGRNPAWGVGVHE